MLRLYHDFRNSVKNRPSLDILISQFKRAIAGNYTPISYSNLIVHIKSACRSRECTDELFSSYVEGLLKEKDYQVLILLIAAADRRTFVSKYIVNNKNVKRYLNAHYEYFAKYFSRKLKPWVNTMAAYSGDNGLYEFFKRFYILDNENIIDDLTLITYLLDQNQNEALRLHDKQTLVEQAAAFFSFMLRIISGHAAHFSDFLQAFRSISRYPRMKQILEDAKLAWEVSGEQYYASGIYNDTLNLKVDGELNGMVMAWRELEAMGLSRELSDTPIIQGCYDWVDKVIYYKERANHFFDVEQPVLAIFNYFIMQHLIFNRLHASSSRAFLAAEMPSFLFQINFNMADCMKSLNLYSHAIVFCQRAAACLDINRLKEVKKRNHAREALQSFRESFLGSATMEADFNSAKTHYYHECCKIYKFLSSLATPPQEEKLLAFSLINLSDWLRLMSVSNLSLEEYELRAKEVDDVYVQMKVAIKEFFPRRAFHDAIFFDLVGFLLEEVRLAQDKFESVYPQQVSLKIYESDSLSNSVEEPDSVYVSRLMFLEQFTLAHYLSVIHLLAAADRRVFIKQILSAHDVIADVFKGKKVLNHVDAPELASLLPQFSIKCQTYLCDLLQLESSAHFQRPASPTLFARVLDPSEQKHGDDEDLLLEENKGARPLKTFGRASD